MKSIAIITGASSGMGREFAMQICENFMSISELWIVARREDRLDELAKDISIPTRKFVGDLSDKTLFDELAVAFKEKPVKIKMLVNCAGYGKFGEVEMIDESEQLGMIDVNCYALTKLTKLCIPYMAYNGRIINLASSAGFLPQPSFAVYAATKSFVLSLSRALNEELRKEYIYVTAVCPGPVQTEFFNIAETTGKTMWFKKFIMAKPDKVVHKALVDSMHKKTVSVYGVPIILFRLLSKTVPHDVILHFYAKMMK